MQDGKLVITREWTVLLRRRLLKSQCSLIQMEEKERRKGRARSTTKGLVLLETGRGRKRNIKKSILKFIYSDMGLVSELPVLFQRVHNTVQNNTHRNLEKFSKRRQNV